MPVQFPAFCRACGLIFESRAFGFGEGGAYRITMFGNQENCPRCGKWADLPDGTFDVIGDTIHVLSGPGWTRERLERLAAILAASETGELSERKAFRAIKADAPEVAGLIKRLRPKMGKALTTFLLMAVGAVLSQALAEHRDHSASKADVTKAVERAVEQCLSEHRHGP